MKSPCLRYGQSMTVPWELFTDIHLFVLTIGLTPLWHCKVPEEQIAYSLIYLGHPMQCLICALVNVCWVEEIQVVKTHLRLMKWNVWAAPWAPLWFSQQNCETTCLVYASSMENRCLIFVKTISHAHAMVSHVPMSWVPTLSLDLDTQVGLELSWDAHMRSAGFEHLPQVTPTAAWWQVELVDLDNYNGAGVLPFYVRNVRICKKKKKVRPGKPKLRVPGHSFIQQTFVAYLLCARHVVSC